MNRKRWIGLLLWSLFIAGAAEAQQSWKVLPWKSHVTWYDYLTEKLHERYATRKQTLELALQNGTLKAYQDSIRARYLRLLGTLPSPSPLQAQVTFRRRESGYVLEHVLFESWPHHHITANLYEPENGRGPWPGVLFFCGHEMSSKATLTYQKSAMLFARHGFVVLVIDPISQGERIQLTDSQGRSLTRGATTEHTLLDAGSNLVGTSVAAYQLWDNERALDYLCSLPEVDTSRLGCLGNSGGGTQTTYFMAYDPRIKVAAPSSYVTRRERSLELLGPQDGCQWLCSEGQYGLDISDYLVAFAPKPVLILAGRYDFVDFNGVQDVYQELQHVYRNLGASDRVGLFATDSGHGIQKPKREAALGWFRRWLYADSQALSEGQLNSLSLADLQVSPTGQLNSSFSRERDIQNRNLSLGTSQIKHTRLTFSLSKVTTYLNAWLGKDSGRIQVDTQQLGTRTYRGASFTALVLRRAAQPPMPLWVHVPRHPSACSLLLSASGKDAVFSDSSLMQQMLLQPRILIVADLRGMGETADPAAFNDKKYMNREYRNAMISLFLGEPLPLQRLQDIRSLEALASVLSPGAARSLDIRASGPCAQAALLAAALDPHILSLELSREGPGFLDLLQHPLTPDAYSYIIPGALLHIDRSDLVRALGHRIHSPVNHPLP